MNTCTICGITITETPMSFVEGNPICNDCDPLSPIPPEDTMNDYPQPDRTNREIARLDAIERWNVGDPNEWPTPLTADAIRTALKQQAADNDWLVPDIHQLEADVEVILDYLCDAELEHMEPQS